MTTLKMTDQGYEMSTLSKRNLLARGGRDGESVAAFLFGTLSID
jgi:hypothetical protein